MTDAKVDPAALAERLAHAESLANERFDSEHDEAYQQALKDVLAALRQRPQEERPMLTESDHRLAGVSGPDPLDGVNTLENSALAPSGDEPGRIPSAPEERPDLIADVERLQRRLGPGLHGFRETLDHVLSALRAQPARKEPT